MVSEFDAAVRRTHLSKRQYYSSLYSSPPFNNLSVPTGPCDRSSKVGIIPTVPGFQKFKLITLPQ